MQKTASAMACTLEAWHSLSSWASSEQGSTPGGEAGGCLSHSSSSDFLTILFSFSFLLFLIKLAAAQLILFQTTWQCGPIPVVENKRAKSGCMQQSEATGSEGPAHISPSHADWAPRQVQPCSTEENHFPFSNCRKSPFPFKGGS